MLRCDTDFGLMCIRSVRNLLSDTHFAILLRSDTDVGVMVHVLLDFFFHTPISLRAARLSILENRLGPILQVVQLLLLQIFELHLQYYCHL